MIHSGALIQTRFWDHELAYTGHELRPHFLLEKMDLRGSAVAAFIGPCQVNTSELVDWEDRLASDHICAARMVHFIAEFFNEPIEQGVLRQRLAMATLREVMQAERPEISNSVVRRGDDLFYQERKLSVSIVTASPVSLLMHVGINIDPTGAPVAAVGLAELGIEPVRFAKTALSRWAEEWSSIEWACTKVRPVM